MQANSSLSIEAVETFAPASILSTPLQLETMVNAFRSERLAWQVITAMKLYQSIGFSKGFAEKFPQFDAKNPTPEAQSFLLDLFRRQLTVRALPRTLLIEIRFRCKDAALSAAVVNQVIAGYIEIENSSRVDATRRDSVWLQLQLDALTRQVEEKEKLLALFERKHNFTSAQVTAGGQPQELLHDPTALQADEAGRALAAASEDRILREALYEEARKGNPEQVLMANPGLAAEIGATGATLAGQLRTRLGDIATELAQLTTEHGPNFPRVLELEGAKAQVREQLDAQDASLIEAFRRTWQAAQDREKLLRQQLDRRMTESVEQNDASIAYSVQHQEIESDRTLCLRLKSRIQEASLVAGVHASSILVLDYARVPFKPVTPQIPLYLAIATFVGFWLGSLLAIIRETWPLSPKPLGNAAAALMFFVLLAQSGFIRGQAPTPNTSGLPSGVVRLPLDEQHPRTPDSKEAPADWSDSRNPPATAQVQSARLIALMAPAMALPIAGGDFLEIGESHDPEFHSSVRVDADGSVTLPLVGRVDLQTMSEQEASRAIEKLLLEKGMLLHPQVSVLIKSTAGQDVSVLGEVTHPGIYPYTLHHRLLDLISAASGLSPTAGRLVTQIHRDHTLHSYSLVLDPKSVASDIEQDHDPELQPGDTIIVNRAGLVYVVGDVVRPGGFAVDPEHGLTVVQAIALAWGATQNAAASKAILIREQAGGRTLTTLNLRRMIHGQDPDLPIQDRDILFIPDSATRELLNKSLETAIQSAIGVSIYAGLVYSQRF